MNVDSPEIHSRTASSQDAHASALLMVSDVCSSFIVKEWLRDFPTCICRSPRQTSDSSSFHLETIFYPLSTLNYAVKICPDGTTLSRDPLNNCESAHQQKSSLLNLHVLDSITQFDLHWTNVSSIFRFNSTGRFPRCPIQPCSLDILECPDGTFVTRDPMDNVSRTM